MRDKGRVLLSIVGRLELSLSKLVLQLPTQEPMETLILTELKEAKKELIKCDEIIGENETIVEEKLTAAIIEAYRSTPYLFSGLEYKGEPERGLYEEREVAVGVAIETIHRLRKVIAECLE